MERVDRPLPLDGEQQVNGLPDAGNGLLDFRLGIEHRWKFVGREVVADAVRNDEIPVGEPLHQRAGSQAVGAMIGEVGFANHKQAGDRALQVVVHPQAAHGVVNGGVNAHGTLYGSSPVMRSYISKRLS